VAGSRVVRRSDTIGDQYDEQGEYLDRFGVGSRLALILSTPVGGAAASGAEKTIFEFRGGDSGAQPNGPLITDPAGNFLGTTSAGGSHACERGCGTVFKLSPKGQEKTLYEFQGGEDGGYPGASLVADGSGNLYGTTTSFGLNGHGTIFKVTTDGKETSLYAFQGGSDGWGPSGLILDSSGNLYGTTTYGGNFSGSDCAASGCGTIFEVESNGSKVILYLFQGGNDGYWPLGGLFRDSEGNLYGTTYAGGGSGCSGGGCGTVFELPDDGNESVLHTFQGGDDGSAPFAGVTMDGAGDLFGTTDRGGVDDDGTVYEISAGGAEQVIHAFLGGQDGEGPFSALVLDASGNLYGTTNIGSVGCRAAGCGTVFELQQDGTKQLLYAFSPKHGKLPETGLLLGENGKLYGTAVGGGRHNNGVVFSVTN
jgi:uncharacterized repeat protein (TIGR03803 family)